MSKKQTAVQLQKQLARLAAKLEKIPHTQDASALIRRIGKLNVAAADARRAEQRTKNPVQRRGAVDGGRTRYIRRPSQITKKKPTKRLRKRRGKNYDRPTKGRFPNPSRKGFVICAKKGTGPKMHYDGVKFSQRPQYKVFPSQAAALAKAREFLRRYRVLRGYAVTVEPNF